METVCVTGAGGYVGSWVVKVLLEKGYKVHGTVRDPSDDVKNGHLKSLKHAAENLKLFKADLLDYEGLCAAIEGCTGVFHVASPVPGGRRVENPEVELIEPAVTGTKKVLDACLKAKVKKVVVVSSIVSMLMNPSWPQDKPMDENCWSDIEFCKATDNWYPVSKTIAEKEAIDYAKKNGLNMVTILPSIVIGPMLQSTLNASSFYLLSYLKDASETLEDSNVPLVDVRDCADAIVLAYEKPEAEGRYLCYAYNIPNSVLVEQLKSKFPKYKYTKSFTEPSRKSPGLTAQKLQSLGWKFKSLEESLVDAVKNFEENGLLVKE